MKCAYKQAQQKERFSAATESMITIYQGISVLALRECFGFGIKRFERYCGEVVSDMSDLIAVYQGSEKDKNPDGVIDSYFSARRTIKDFGVDVDAIDREYKPDDGMNIIGGKETIRRFTDRKVFLNSVEVSAGVIWCSSMIWLHDTYGYGVLRLSRYYRRCKGMFREFAQSYLRFDNDKCAKFIQDLRDNCNALGVLI